MHELVFSAGAFGRGRVVVVNANRLKVVEEFLVEIPAGLEGADHSSHVRTALLCLPSFNAGEGNCYRWSGDSSRRLRRVKPDSGDADFHLETTKTVTVIAPPPPSVPKTIMETDGMYRVGTDIVPGTYRSAGPSAEGASDCYWARLSSLNETHIIESNISTGAQAVMIPPSDRAFLTHSCQPWRKAD